MPGLDNLSVKIFAVAGVVSILLVSLKQLAKQFQSVALEWIRVYKKIKAEKNKQ